MLTPPPPTPGYYRQPTIYGDTIVFVSEDDLWAVDVGGGPARRLTAGRGAASHPAFSLDGSVVAFTGNEDGNTEAWVISPQGGPTRRVTWSGSGDLRVVGWERGTGALLVVSSAGEPFLRTTSLWRVGAEQAQAERLGLGHATFLDLGEPGAAGLRPAILTRHSDDLAYWKRYRGGRAGTLWLDATGEGRFAPFLDELGGGFARGMWYRGQVLFLSDHEGYANLYLAAPDGSGLRRLTHHDTYVARHPRTDGERIVYACGADLWVIEGPEAAPRRVEVEFHSPRTWRQRRYPAATSFFESQELHPEGHELAVICRGKPFVFGLWEGGVRQLGEPQGVRYRLPRFLPDGRTLVLISDAGGGEAIELHPAEGGGAPRRLEGLELGFVLAVAPSPDGAWLAVGTDRMQLHLIPLGSGGGEGPPTARLLDASRWGRITELSWSADGRYLAWSAPTSTSTACIRVADLQSGWAVHDVTESEFRDVGPVFDPQGRYLYFITYREFDPVYDAQLFDLGFPRGMRLAAVTLRPDVAHPFNPAPRPVGRGGKKADDNGGEGGEKNGEGEEKSAEGGEKKGGEGEKKGEGRGRASAVIDFEGIRHRIALFPLTEGRFSHLCANEDSIFFVVHKVSGSLRTSWQQTTPAATSTLRRFDLSDQEARDVQGSMTGAWLKQRGKALVIQAGSKLRVVSASFDTNNKHKDLDKPGRKSGWVELGRVSLAIDPPAEWRQMLHEAWRLMRDNFWADDLSGVDWEAMWARYAPLLDRVGARSEFSDLVWELHGETGTSHAYEMGGDYRRPPRHPRGFLGADFAFHAETGGARIARIVRDDAWHPSDGSPLGRPGVPAREGDVIVAVDGQRLSAETPLDALLMDRANRHVQLTVVGPEGNGRRTFSVRALSDERPIRYRAWVNRNREAVHAASSGRLGYLHVPDMGPRGYAEFHRGLLSEEHREGLVVDVRFNGGGHVSQLLIEKLARRRVALCVPRHGAPEPWPSHTVPGPIVCLTNAFAGSDGDIFSHTFKLYKLGTLIGTRTWGGVIGIWPRHRLVDESFVTQPEFSFWFEDARWGVENRGTEPDEVVDIAPHDYREGHDPQLERAIALGLEALRHARPLLPELGPRPRRAAPPLPDKPEQA